MRATRRWHVPVLCKTANSDIDEFLDPVDQWKFKLHEKLKRRTPAQRKAFWNQIHEDARARGLPVVEPERPAKRPTMRVRRTGQHAFACTPNPPDPRASDVKVKTGVSKTRPPATRRTLSAFRKRLQP